MMSVNLEPLGVAITACLHRECRDAGWTLDALSHPISVGARAVRCARNGVGVSAGPRVWDYAPNALVAQELEAAARLGTTAYVRIADRGM